MKLLITILVVLVICAVVYYFSCSMEGFGNCMEKIKILIFVSTSCPHCVDYESNRHQAVLDEYKNKPNVEVSLIVAGQDPENLFKTYNVMYVPACIIIKGDTTEKLEGPVGVDNIKQKIGSM